ncbi:uncharacterized protein LOC120341673 [Styela clava]
MNNTTIVYTTSFPGRESELSGDNENMETKTWKLDIENITCIREDNGPQIIELAFASASLPLHLFVLIAMIVHRDVVKRNVVNLYAANVILSSVVGNVWRILALSGTISETEHVEFKTNITGSSMDVSETLKKSVLLIMILVTSGSIALVINAMRSIQFRVHRTVGGLANIGTEETCPVRNEKEKMTLTKKLRISLKNHPRMWAVLNISIIWIIPLLLIIFMVVFNSCKYVCHCSYNHYPSLPYNGTKCENSGNYCSSFIPPISKLTLVVGFGTWIAYFLMLTLLLAKTYRDLQLLTKQRRIGSTRILTSDKHEDGVNNTELNGKESSEKALTSESPDMLSPHQPSPTKSIGESPTPNQGKPQVKIHILEDTAPTSRRSGSIFIESLRKNFKLLFVMYLAYGIGTTPMGVVALIDGSVGDIEERIREGIIVLVLLPMVAEFICTIMLCMYLSGVKTATRSLLVKIGRCCWP